MGILLTILAAAGKILLIILLLLLLLLLLVLFVPISYRVYLEGEKKRIESRAGVTWLFRAVAFEVYFRKAEGETGKQTDLRLFGVSLPGLKKKLSDRKKKKIKQQKKKQLEAVRKTDPDQYEQLRAEALARKKEREEERRRREAEERAMAEERTPAPPPVDSGLSKKERRRRRRIRKTADFLLFLKRMILRVFEFAAEAAVRILELPGKVMERLLRFISDAAATLRKIRRWTDFLLDARTKRAAVKLKKALFGILRAVRPRRITGRAAFGFDDPALTGEAAGLAYALQGPAGNHLLLIPDFTEKKFEGNLEIAGRIFLVRIAAAALGAIISKDVRYCYRFIKNRDKEAA